MSREHAIRRAAAAWRDCEVQPGEAVVVLLPAGAERDTALLGAALAGARPSTQLAASRFVLALSRSGFDNHWRDRVITLAEWRVALAEARVPEAVFA